jgi:hypothetical protein
MIGDEEVAAVHPRRVIRPDPSALAAAGALEGDPGSNRRRAGRNPRHHSKPSRRHLSRVGASGADDLGVNRWY